MRQTTKAKTGAEALIPVMVILDGARWERVYVGLCPEQQVQEWAAGKRDRITLTRSRTVLWYTKQSGGLDGVAVDGMKGGNLSTPRELPRHVGGIKDLGLLTATAWAQLCSAAGVS